jgi:acetolactate synthase-1/2/3 large subunit
VAVSGCPGPVHLQFAGNEGQIDQEEAEMEALAETRFRQVPPFRPAAGDHELRSILARIEAADRPVIVAGGGVRASGAGAALVQLAERLQLPVATSLNGKDTIPGAHPLSVGVVGTYSRASANRVVAEADLVVFIGTTAGGMTTHFWQVPPPGRPAIQIDINPEELGRNYPLEVGIQADALTALGRLLELSEPSHRDRAWLDRASGLASAWREEWRPLTESTAVPLRPERIASELSVLLPEDAVVVVDTGHAGMWMGGFFDLGSPSQSYLRSAGHLGWAFPASLGAKCGVASRPVVCFTGDAGLWYHLAEIETAVRFGINTVTVVNDNHSGNQSMRGFDRAYGGRQTEKARELWVFTEVDFARLAEEMGAIGIRVERPEQFPAALEKGLAADRPVVIDVVTDLEAVAPPAVTS